VHLQWLKEATMKTPVLLYALIAGCLSFAVPACNTTKATIDILVTFTPSTTLGTVFTEDGVLQEEHKAIFFTTLNFENLRHDVAQGHGEYLTSLSALLHIRASHQDEFFGLAQRHYAALDATDQTTPSQWLAMLMRDWTVNRTTTQSH
jgi:hypothetical protein